MLLDFLGPDGVEAGGKYNLLPIKLIGELDGRLSRPLHLKLKRPQIRSHPYLQGLNLLLRATGLTRVENVGSKARLVLCPELLMQWDQLNPTERYFNLLEAWLDIGRAEMVGETDRRSEPLYRPCLEALMNLRNGNARFNRDDPQYFFISGIYRSFYLAALMDLFGFVKLTFPPRSATTWVPAGFDSLPLGEAVFALLYSRIGFGFRHDYFDLIDEEQPSDDDEEGDEDGGDDASPEGFADDLPQFGVWQPVFQPYFPEWQNNLVLPEPETREGTFVFRVSLGDVWRRIAMPAHDTLDDLVGMMLRSVNFDDDHLYAFTYRGSFGSEFKANHPGASEGPWADQIPIGKLPLEPGQSMELVYDFGDHWSFDVKLERIEPPRGKGKAKAARILERHGKAPEQYTCWYD
jgi:hypothetical protein